LRLPRFLSGVVCAFLSIYPLNVHAQIIDDPYIIEDYAQEPADTAGQQAPALAETVPAQQKPQKVRPGNAAMYRRAELFHDFFVGLEIAKRFEYSYVNPSGKDTSWPAFEGSNTTWLFGFNLRKYFGGNFGLGMEVLFMGAHTERDPFSAPDSPRYFEATITPFLIDFDLLFRFPFTRWLLLNAGAGLTFECMFYKLRKIYSGFSNETIDSGSGGSQPGYNLKIGVEFFLDPKERLSVTLDGKLQYWRSGFGQEKFTIYTVGVGLAYCL
jgi:hypothetical protein